MNEEGEVALMRQKHAAFALGGLKELSSGFVVMDASRAWIIYWACQTFSLLDVDFSHDYEAIIGFVDFLFFTVH